jgi:hypothetical protein
MRERQLKRCQHCGKKFIRTNGRQKFCTAKCRRRVEHLRYVEKYPEEKSKRMDALLAWKKAHPLRAIRIKRRFFKPVGMPTWLTGV